MAISVANALTSAAGGSSSPITTASVSPASGCVVFFVLNLEWTSGNTTPTIAGNGLTWSLVGRQDANDALESLIVWEGHGTPSAGTIVVTRVGSDTWDRACYSVFEFTGANTTTPIVAANTVSGNTSGGGTTHSLNYNQAFAAGSAGVGFFAGEDDNATALPRASWTEIHDLNSGGGFVLLETQYINGSDTAGSVTWSTNIRRHSLIAELAVAASGGSFRYFYGESPKYPG